MNLDLSGIFEGNYFHSNQLAKARAEQKEWDEVQSLIIKGPDPCRAGIWLDCNPTKIKQNKPKHEYPGKNKST